MITMEGVDRLSNVEWDTCTPCTPSTPCTRPIICVSIATLRTWSILRRDAAFSLRPVRRKILPRPPAHARYRPYLFCILYSTIFIFHFSFFIFQFLGLEHLLSHNHKVQVNVQSQFNSMHCSSILMDLGMLIRWRYRDPPSFLSL